MATSTIGWTEKVWNFLAGCDPISPGCLNCYAAAMAVRLEAMGQTKYMGTATRKGGRAVFTGHINVDEDALLLPTRWKKPTTIFVNSMSDLFHEQVPDDLIDRAWWMMGRQAPQHTYIVLTKRAQRMHDWVTRAYDGNIPYPNIWLLVSTENQETANERIPLLIDTPAAVRGISAEPLLGPIDLTPWLHGLHWMVIGGESGPKARPCDSSWMRSLAQQGQGAGVAVYVKQIGSVAAKRQGRRGKGEEQEALPLDLRLRQYPQGPQMQEVAA